MRHWLKDDSFRSLVKNTSYLAVSKGVSAVAGIATLAFAGRALGLVEFGLLILIASYAQAASGLTKFQSWQLIIRYGGAALTSGDQSTFKRSIGFGLGLDASSGLVGMTAETKTATGGRARGNLRFAGHYLEMVVAMFVGMAALAPLWSRVWPSLSDMPAADAMVMAFDMTLGMALWMAVRRHPWRRSRRRERRSVTNCRVCRPGSASRPRTSSRSTAR